MKEVYVEEIQKTAEELRETYMKIVQGEIKVEKYPDVIKRLLTLQKDDGAWTKVEDYHMDSDCRVAYVYEPTYYGCAAMIFMDLQLEFAKESREAHALEKGLEFAKGRSLNGHGFDAICDKMKAMELFEDAGIYQWFQKYPGKSMVFRIMWKRIIEGMKKGLDTGKVFGDWNVDFSKEMKERVEKYHNYNSEQEA